MLKKFSLEGRIESGLETLITGKVWAFTAVVLPNDSRDSKGFAFGLGAAAANEPGYWPIPLAWCHGDNYIDMCDHADELNRALGLTALEAAKIIASSMGSKIDVPNRMPKPRD